MSRRVILGDAGGGNYKFAVSKPGYDAATAGLEGLLFDAQNVPFRFKRMPDIQVPAILSGGGDHRPPASTYYNHGLGFTPWVLAIARPVESNGAAVWWFWRRTSSSTAWFATLQGMNLPAGSWTCPWRQEGQTGNTADAYYGGWWHDADSSNIVFNTWGCGLIVRWGYIEVS